jgi:hypothetical protein
MKLITSKKIEITSSEAFFRDQQAEYNLWKPASGRPYLNYKRLPLPDHDVQNCIECQKAKVKAVDDFNATLGYSGAPRAHECGPFSDPAAKRVHECWRVEGQRFGILISTRCQEWKKLLEKHNTEQQKEYLKALRAQDEK